MTRGTLYIVTNEGCWSSTEFNGDMYPEGHGDRVMELLKNCNTYEQFCLIVEEFNKLHHKYAERQLVYPCQKQFFHDFAKDYSNDYFSDWTFFKNASSKDVEFKLWEKSDLESLMLRPGNVIRFKFGRFYDETKRR